jgi:crossover junction endodeoxyribonuclease RuvC
MRTSRSPSSWSTRAPARLLVAQPPRAQPLAVRVLGIDPALTVTGYGVIVAEGSTFRSLQFGCVAPDPKLPLPERLNRIYGAISQVITEYEPHEVAVEDFIVGHVRAAVAVGEARAMALLAAARRNLPVSLYKPSEVKQFVTSYGRGSKEQVALMVQALLGLDAPPTPPDAADALAVAICHCLRRNSISRVETPRRGVSNVQRPPSTPRSRTPA